MFLIVPTSGGKQQNESALTRKVYSVLFNQSLRPKAEPFKRWLAKVGYERVQEIENPNWLPKERMLYKLKGYSDELDRKKGCAA